MLIRDRRRRCKKASSEGGGNLLLDNISNLTLSGVWSLVRELTSYTGYLCDIRIDNVGQDEYRVKYDDNNVFSLNSPCYNDSDVYQDTLGNLVGSDNAFCKKYYTHLGNGKDFIQNTAALQPKIISSGNLITENNSPVLYFLGGDYMQIAATTLINQIDGKYTLILAGKDESDDTTTDHFLDQDHIGTNRIAQFFRKDGGLFRTIAFFNAGGLIGTTVAKSLGIFIATVTNDASNLILQINDGATNSAIVTSNKIGAGKVTLGAYYNGTLHWKGRSGAVIISSSINSTDKNTVRNALITRYGIS